MRPFARIRRPFWPDITSASVTLRPMTIRNKPSTIFCWPPTGVPPFGTTGITTQEFATNGSAKSEKAVEKFTYRAWTMPLRPACVKMPNGAAWRPSNRQRRVDVKPYSLYFQTGYMQRQQRAARSRWPGLALGKATTAPCSAIFAGSYDFLKTGTWTLGAGYSHYHLDYQRHDEFDLERQSFPGSTFASDSNRSFFR